MAVAGTKLERYPGGSWKCWLVNPIGAVLQVPLPNLDIETEFRSQNSENVGKNLKILQGWPARNPSLRTRTRTRW